MNLYLLTQDDNNGYDTYDACIVAAESEDDARNIHPRKSRKDEEWFLNDEEDGWNSAFAEWTAPTRVKVRLIATALVDVERGVILASFNAG